MQISSPAFSHNGKIPARYTCDGANINPPLVITDVPKLAQSLALIMDDPDVPKNIRPDGLWVHWLVWDIPTTTSQILEDTAPGIVGTGTRGVKAYTGPCPPDQEHHYFFKLYALDAKLNLPATTTKDQLEQAMTGHIITQTELIGVYKR